MILSTKMLLRKTFLFTLITLIIFSSKGVHAQMADLILHNATIYTVNEAQPWAEALAIKDGKIIYIGTEENINDYIDNNTELINLEGLMVLPGFQDAHLHVLEGGLTESYCIFEEQASFKKHEAQAKQCAKEWQDADWILGAGVYAAGLIEQITDEGELPIDVLDRVAPNKPMFILDSVGHGAWANTKALEAVGYNNLTQQPQGGLVHRDETTSRLSGVVFENAYQKLQDAAWEVKNNNEAWKLEESTLGLNFGLQALAENGITSVSDAGGYWPRKHEQIWQDLETQDQMTTRASNALYVYPDKPFDEQINELKKRFSNNPNNLVNFNQAKLYVDGIISYGTSSLLAPYTTQPPSPLSAPLGYQYFDLNLLIQYAVELDKIGFQLHFHATGDQGVRLALNAIETAQKQNGTQDKRHRITHLYQVHKNDIPRFKELGVIADIQISQSNQDPDYLYDVQSYLNTRAQRLLPLEELLESGATVTLSSDWDAASLSPFVSIQNTLENKSLDLETIIKLKTINTAYLLHQENKTGSLEIGKYADLIVIDRNLFETRTNKINEIEVLLTLLEGKEIYKAGNF